MSAKTLRVHQGWGQLRVEPMTKKVTGVNPDYADYAELDTDALDAVEEFMDGQISYDELKNLVGVEAATVLKEIHFGKDDPESYFDDPESL